MTGSANSQFNLQDASGGIVVYVAAGTSIPNYGDTVQVTGPLGQYNGLLELTLSAANPDQSVSDLGGGTLPTPAPFVFASAANIPYMEATEGSLVTVSNVYLFWTNADFLTGTVTMTNLNGQTFPLYVNAGVLNIQGTPIPVFASSVTGVLSQYKSSAPYTSGYELDVTQYADVVAGTPLPPEPLPIPLNVQVSGNNLVLTWSDSSFSLQSSTNVSGPYTTVPASVGLSTYTDTETNQALFYRLMHP
jgi:hypothetical protein